MGLAHKATEYSHSWICFLKQNSVMCNTTTGFDVDLSKVVDPHTVAGLLKLHFREQRFSMIPRGQPLSNITQAVRDKDV